MGKRRFLLFLLILALLTGAVSAASPKLPYAIKVNRGANTVTIYGLDGQGDHTVPVKAMICSTARQGYTMPMGTFYLQQYRSEWRLMLDGTYGQYATCFKGNYLFHSICYSDDAHDAMIMDAYNALGEKASMGCVRLQTVDAKWIYDNCPAGTPVTIYDDPSDPGPLGKPDKAVSQITHQMHNGWDPTDPAPENPWLQKQAEKISLKPAKLSLNAGQTAAPEVAVEPEAARLFWTSSDEAVAQVDGSGTITALSSGKAVITAHGTDGISASCTVTVKGELLPYDDLTVGAWYYEPLQKAVEQGLMQGISERAFRPAGQMTRAMAVQVLYNMEKGEAAKSVDFEDVAEGAWYHDAVAWAASTGLVTGVSKTRFLPDSTLTRQELATILWRCAGMPEAEGDLQSFSDREEVSAFAETALCWMTGQGLMQGSGGRLQPQSPITRAETAVLLQRYLELK